jgi:hypothetical protein
MRAFEGKMFDVLVEDGKEIVVHGPAVAIVAVERERQGTLVR